MGWIAYNNRQYPRQNWPELLHLLENEGEWQQDVSRFIQSWLSEEMEFSVQTSGSTGVPKTLQLSRAAMEASARATARAFEIQPGAHVLCCLPVRFIAGKMMVVRALVNDWNLILTRPDAEALRGMEMHVDFAAMTPYQVEQSMVRFPNRFQSIGKLIIGGAATSPLLESQLNDFPVRAWATYGMTETITHVAARELDKKESNDVFQALHGIQFSVTEEGALRIHADHLPNGVITTNDLVALLSPTQFK
ncbi:MAG: AMP-binding protein, partial [Flavobacteriales bacterium]|nr:AMP-binding protein [Flavobacteriales bacterium]